MDKIKKYPLTKPPGFPENGLGLLTDEPGYRLSWLINQNYNWNLEKSADLIITKTKSPVMQSFDCYESHSGFTPAIRLLSNRSNEGLWLTSFEQVDFLLLISDPDPTETFLHELKSTLGTKIPQIRGLFKLPLPSFCYL